MVARRRSPQLEVPCQYVLNLSDYGSFHSVAPPILFVRHNGPFNVTWPLFENTSTRPKVLAPVCDLRDSKSTPIYLNHLLNTSYQGKSNSGNSSKDTRCTKSLIRISKEGIVYSTSYPYLINMHKPPPPTNQLIGYRPISRTELHPNLPKQRMSNKILSRRTSDTKIRTPHPPLKLIVAMCRVEEALRGVGTAGLLNRLRQRARTRSRRTPPPGTTPKGQRGSDRSREGTIDYSQGK